MSPLNEPLSAGPAPEKRSWLIPISIGIVLVLMAGLWLLFRPRGPLPPFLVFENRDLGCRFEYPSSLTAGPNFLKSGAGSILTIERFTLFEAKKDWVAALPDVLFPQVLIQLQETYQEIREVSRARVTVAGRPGLEVLLDARQRPGAPLTRVTIVIFANADWVWILRSYWPERLDSTERPLFPRVLETWRFLPDRNVIPAEAGGPS